MAWESLSSKVSRCDEKISFLFSLFKLVFWSFLLYWMLSELGHCVKDKNTHRSWLVLSSQVLFVHFVQATCSHCLLLCPHCSLRRL